MNSIFRTPQIKISTGSTDNDTVTTKGYVDEHSANAIWTLIGTEVTLTTITNTIGSSTPLKYTSHPAFTIDEQIVDKKYVDDKIFAVAGIEYDHLTVSSPGQTVFTLSQSPVSPNKSILYLNGQKRLYGAPNDYTISGTTLTWSNPNGLTLKTADIFDIYYDINMAPPGVLYQKQIYYVADAGNDGNVGTSIEVPFKTVGAAVAAVLTKSPSFTNQFEIQLIGSMRASESFIIPSHATVTGSGTLIGDITLSAYSHIDGPRIEGKIIKSSGGESTVRSKLISNALGTCIEQTGGILSVYCEEFQHAGATVAIDQSSSSLSYINIDKFNSSAANDLVKVNGINATSYLNIKDLTKSSSGGSALSVINGAYVNGFINAITALAVNAINISGSSKLRLKSNHIIGSIIDDGTNTLSLDYPEKTTFQARTVSAYNNITGDGDAYTVIFETVEENIGSHYNNSTGVFTAPFNGEYLFDAVLYMDGLTALHNKLIIQFQSSLQGPFLLYLNPSSLRVDGDKLIENVSMKLKMAKNETVKVVLIVDGDLLTVNVQPASYFGGTLLRTL